MLNVPENDTSSAEIIMALAPEIEVDPAVVTVPVPSVVRMTDEPVDVTFALIAMVPFVPAEVVYSC